jgi:hypothetical protein
MTKITLKNVLEQMNKRFDEMGRMIKVGFDATASKDDMHAVENRLDSVEERLGSVERTQEDMLLKMDNFAYKFEVVELKKRALKTEGRLNRLETPKS